MFALGNVTGNYVRSRKSRLALRNVAGTTLKDGNQYVSIREPSWERLYCSKPGNYVRVIKSSREQR